MMMKLRVLLASLFLSFVAIMSVGLEMLAQSGHLEWATPVNLSHSGAASSPVIVAVPDGTLRILWWDAFDGLMIAEGAVSALQALDAAPGEPDAGERWSAPAPAPILLPTRVTRDGQEQIIPLPIKVMPEIVADADGRAHAFWLGEPDEETGDQPLLYSRLTRGSTAWSSPSTLAYAAASFDATADISGTVHLAYVQPVQIARAPSGMYYRQSRNGGGWSTGTAIQQSRYLRLLPTEVDSIGLTADDSESVYVTWSDPRTGQGMVAHSADGGASWQEPRLLASSDGAPLRNRVITLPGQPAPILWQPAGQSQRLLAVKSADDALVVSVWDGARWSNTKHLALDLQNPELGGLLYLSDLQLALAAASPDQTQAGQMLVVLGADQNQDLWITGIQAEALQRLSEASSEPTGGPSGEGQGGATAPAATNLSRSGAASSPAILASSDGTLRAFWWDQFDGLMVADGTISVSTVLSGTQEILALHDSWSEPRPVPLPAPTTPRILADATGGVHAFWLQQPTKEQQAAAAGKPQTWPLMHSRLASDATGWLPAVTLAESAVTFEVAADAAGALQVAYVQAVDTLSYLSGVYYRRTGGEGNVWLAPVALDQSRYLRLLSPETAHVRLAADDEGGVYVTWDDPQLEQLLLAYSPDAGLTWQTPKPLPVGEGQARSGQLLSTPGSETLLLWENPSSGARCSLYQAPAAELAGGTETPAQQVLEELATCPDNARFVPFGEGQVLMIAGSGSDSLTLAVWNGEQWSEPTRVSYSFEDPAMGGQVYLADLQAALVGLSRGAMEGIRDQAVIAIGIDQAGDVWATSSQMGTLDLVFAPPPPWSAPLSYAEAEGIPFVPALALDSEGRLHIVWSEEAEGGLPGASLFYARRDQATTSSGTEVRWTSPTEILPSPNRGADQPSLLALGSQLHAVWRGGQTGEILYSQAFANDAYVASGWTEPQPLPSPAVLGSWPHLAADLGGTLHVVYALPVNEGRGIYYTSSADGGQTWSGARQIFDAAAAGWAMSDYPRLAVDMAGTIHVVWTRVAPFGNGLAQAIAYAQTVDGGETWSEPLEVAEGAYAWPQVIASSTGQVHLLWTETAGENACWHRWSTDGGLTWSRTERVPGFGNVPGPVGVMGDASGTVHLVGLGQDTLGAPALLYTAWDGQRWGEWDTYRLDVAVDESVPGVSAVLLPALGRLDVVFRDKGGGEDGTEVTRLWNTGRTVPTVVVTPVPTFTPRPTATPLPTPVPTAFATPTPSFGTAPPQNAEGSIADLLPVLVPGGLAVLIVVGAFGARIVLARRGR